MIYRELGKTGLKVSQLGFGAMRLPMSGEGKDRRVDRELAIPMIHRAFEAGVNYIDTAVGYCNHDSQRVVGEAIKGWGDKIIVSAKNYCVVDEDQWQQNLQDSLEYLGVESIDIYNFHGLSWKRYTEHLEPRLLKLMVKAKDQGLVKRICCSFHDSNEVLMKVIDLGIFESITLQYNMLDRQLEEGMAYAKEKGVGVVVMGPVGGGKLGADSEVLAEIVPEIRRVPELALRFVLANPNVSLTISGMSTMQQVEENIATACDDTSLSEADMKVIDEHLERLAKMVDLYCTGCKYCLPCPAGVGIPYIFNIYNHGRVYGLWEHARKAYSRLMKNPPERSQSAEACTECEECEEKCPQNIPIRKQLKEAHKALTKDKD